jgi:dihydroxyacetone kinase-like protein
MFQQWARDAYEAHWRAKDLLHREAPVIICEMELPAMKALAKQACLRTAMRALLFVGRHSHVPALLDVFRDHGREFFVFQAIEGETLLARLRRTRQMLSEQEAIEVCLQVTEALDAISQSEPPAIHGLISPAHILMTRNGRWVLTNFSIVLASSAYQYLSDLDPSLLSPFSAPEFREGMIDNRSDLYSLLATAYYVVMGKFPQEQGRTTLTSSFDTVFKKGLHSIVSQRYQHPSALLCELMALQPPARYSQTRRTHLPSSHLEQKLLTRIPVLARNQEERKSVQRQGISQENQRSALIMQNALTPVALPLEVRTSLAPKKREERVPMTTQDIKRWLNDLSHVLHEHCGLLTQLDAAIGDADHGINLERGFQAVSEQLPNMTDTDIGSLLKAAGTTLISTVGGASGPLFGAAFLRAGIATSGKHELHEADLVKMLEAALEGIKARGKAVPGEKTMVDAFAPALEAARKAELEQVDPLQLLHRASMAAEEGMKRTSLMVAKKGRASYLGERSLGHQDPGATSSWLLLKTLAKSIDHRRGTLPPHLSHLLQDHAILLKESHADSGQQDQQPRPLVVNRQIRKIHLWPPASEQKSKRTQSIYGHNEASIKKLINRSEDVIKEALAGMESLHPELLRLDSKHQVIVRADAPVQGKVGIISGGGSGHEPMHGGFVGRGMLDAACPGAIFTSPVPDQMLAATHAVNGGAGVLHIVKNYTGDVLNFEMAAELAQAEGIHVASVVTNDDVAVQDSLYTAGRRGVGVTLLLEKIVGGMAEAGAPLAVVAEMARKVNEQGRSMGMALTSCTTPAAGKPTFNLSDDEMEIGIGIHGEPGCRRTKLTSAAEITEMLAFSIITDLELKAGERVLAFVNGMGGTPLIELYIVAHSLAKILHGKNIPIVRTLIGSYITSLEMAGCSITLLRLDDEMIRYWDAPVHTPALRWGM